MDIKDAHKVVENLQTRPFICSENTIKLDNGYVIAKKEYFQELQEAREKQTPKKPIKQHEEQTEKEWEELADLGFGGGDVMRCPNCNEYVVIDKLKYCMECGQKLDWT